MRCMSLFDGDMDGDPRDHECQLGPGHLDAGLPHQCECGETWGIRKCAELTCPCGCGNVVRTWHGPDCPDDCDI